MTTINKGKLILYLCCIFIVFKVAGKMGGEPQGDSDDLTHISDPEIREKLIKFREAGVEKAINTRDYEIEDVIEYAKSLLGTPHVMGGYSRSGVDCSGLVALVHAQFDVQLPRSSHDQGRYGTIVFEAKELKRGDLVFFHSTYPKSELITHAGIYLGDNQFIHTSSSRGVTISVLMDSSYWQKHFLFGTRLRD